MILRPLLPLLISTTLAAALHASIQSDIGYTQLKEEYGAALPDGSNLTMLQVEAPNSSGNWRPAVSGGIAYVKIAYPMDATLCSGTSSHANQVAANFASSTVSVLPKLGSLLSSSGARYRTISLQAGLFRSPTTATWDVENHSYVGTSTTYDVTNLRLMDYRIDRDGVTVCVALMNGTAPMTPLWGNTYNTITVGTYTGQHTRGGTAMEGSGRQKPDLVGSVAYTSYSTPVVASAAGFLIAETKRTASLAVAKDPRVVKALLMAGATKERFTTWSHTPAQPLDPIYGAGQVSVYNSYKALVAGRQPAGTEWRNTRGWDLGKSGTNAVYYFEVPAGQTMKFSTVLTWHRSLSTSDYWVFNASLADLNLRLRNSNTSFALGTVVAESRSGLDNVEHIYCPTLPAGKYALEVTGPAGTTYGIAWNGILSGGNVSAPTPTDTATSTVVAPSITTQPVSQSVTAGDAARFSVAATGTSPTYQWYKNGTALTGATGSSLAIAATSTSDAGSYTVAVKNSSGSVTSAAATLTVRAASVGAEAPAANELIPASFSARGQNGTKEGTAMLFDHNATTKWLDFSGTTWVQVDLGSAAQLTSYSLTSANDTSSRDPYTWTVSGSNDGVTWTAIETRTGQTFATRNLQRDFVLSTPSAAYQYFRFDITCRSGTTTQLAELKLLGASSSASKVADAPVVSEPEVAPAPDTTPATELAELTPASISARGQNGTKEGAAMLFDHTDSTKWLDFSGTTWVQVAFTAPHSLESYSLTSANDYVNRDPASWTVSGSNDGVTWTVIETRTGETFASRKLQRDFVLNAPSAAYQYFRIEMTCKSGSTTQLAELELWGR